MPRRPQATPRRPPAPRRPLEPAAPPVAEPLQCFAIAAPGFEPLVAAELRALGIDCKEEPGGAAWQGDLASVYRANLWLRTASRVLVRVGEFHARTFFELERHARRVEWARWLARNGAVRFRVTTKKSKLYHSDAVAERLATAATRALPGVTVVGAARGDDETSDEAEGAERADAGGVDDAQLFVVRVAHDRVTLSVDASGALLHRRGYRQAVAKAPLRETMAAGMLLASGWDGGAPLLDPLCGSGTILIEAAMLARRLAPGARRRFAFMDWPGFDRARWDALLDEARARAVPRATVAIQGSDRDAGAVDAARANADRAGVLDDLALSVRALSAVEPPAGAGWLVTNPPYGIRLGEADRVRDLYAQLGKVVRARLAGWTVALLSPDARLESQLRLPLEERLRTRNGGIPVRLVVASVASSRPGASTPQPPR